MKKLIKNTVAGIASTLGSMGLCRAVPILMYHGVEDLDDNLFVSARAFREQMTWLKSAGFRSITLDEYADALTNNRMSTLGRAFVLTLDDAYVDNLRNAVPVLKDVGFSGTIFVPTGCVGDATRWLQDQHEVMTWDEIRECVAAGMAVGAHTVNHPHLGQIPIDEARREIADSKTAIEDHLQQKVDWFCYPYGDRSDEVEKVVEELGFRGAVTTVIDNRNAPTDLYHLTRIYVGPGTSMASFRLALSSLWRARGGGA